MNNLLKRLTYFWKDKEGKELSLKQFSIRFKDGIVNITPLQQTKTTLWSFIPIFAGLTWGIVVTFLVKTYWLTAILTGSLPITSVQFISNLQKYKAQKKAEELFKEAIKTAIPRKSSRRKP